MTRRGSEHRLVCRYYAIKLHHSLASSNGSEGNAILKIIHLLLEGRYDLIVSTGYRARSRAEILCHILLDGCDLCLILPYEGFLLLRHPVIPGIGFSAL